MPDRQRVVVADSDPRRRRTTSTVLRLGGYAVFEADALADIPRVAKDGLDLLLIEATLSDGDGVAYAARIRKNAPTATLPILVATVDRTAGSRIGEALGDEAFLALPVRPSELLGRIASLIGQRAPAQ
jgi:DNA-binding response OmpR family regulator